MIQAIQTKYKGYHFRSRTETRWAVFFDTLGTTWDYEVEGFQLSDGRKYLPDFLVTNMNGYKIWYEIKPANDLGDGKIEVLKKDFDLNHPDDTNIFKLLSGSPAEVLKDHSICPRCTAIIDGGLSSFGANDWFIGCPFCDFNCIHSGGYNPEEPGMIIPVSYHKGELIIYGDYLATYKAKINSAIEAARSARFEFNK